MKNNFLSLCIWFVAWFLATFILKSLHMGGNGVFYGIVVPLAFGAVCWISQIATRYVGKDIEHVFAGIGAALGGGVVIYIIPMLFQVH